MTNNNYGIKTITLRWVWGWKIGEIENGKEIEKREVCIREFCMIMLDWRVEKLRDRKLFCLVKKKNKRIKIRFCINLFLYPYKITFFNKYFIKEKKLMLEEKKN